MRQSRILFLLLALLALAVACAWLVFKPGDEAAGKPFVPGIVADGAETGEAREDQAPTTEPTSTHTQSPPADEQQPHGGDASQPGAAAPGASPSQGNGAQGTPPAGRNTPGSGAQTQPQGGDRGAAQQPRQPTPREREEAARVSTGRPALAERLARTPGASGVKSSLQKSPEQEKWEEGWRADGITPPPMTPTPVTGKIMSEQAREGLAEASVHLMTFFPLDGVAGGPLLPVVTEFKTDAQGNFTGSVPASKLAPQGFPIAAIGVSWEGKRILAAMPIKVLDVGQNNALGIFWAPEIPFVLTCDCTQFNGALSVVSSGELNAQRIHKLKRSEFLASFPAFPVTPRDAEAKEGKPAPGFAELVGTWGPGTMPYISLRDGTELLRTQRPKNASVVSSKSSGPLPEPFETLVFLNESYKPMGGMVSDADGMPVQGAVVATRGGAIQHVAVTDAGGWFFMENPDEKTNALLVTHDQYIEVLHSAQPGDTTVQITLGPKRPLIRLHVIDRQTTQPITDLSIKVVGNHPWGKDKGKAMPAQVVELAASDGRYTLQWPVEVRNITLEKLGYFPKLISKPAADGTEIAIELSPGRKLEITPRNYTSVQQADRWFPDPNNGPGIYTAWSHHWIEYEVDFGDAPAEGEQGGFFDIVLGCTNQGIVDNEYQFVVDIYIDDEKKRTLNIMADSITVREGRASLGALSGVHRIRLMWTNDKWIPDQLDANIRYATLKFLEQPK
ncbi:MAG: hypothetical protein KF696_03555 [Planctomycetes bacterium]|nr:hypothetical protein [Planctomycetota bacterium]MCW8134045.1 hypothetical protein [Planctomycetota bacterium]